MNRTDSQFVEQDREGAIETLALFEEQVCIRPVLEVG